MISRLAKEPPFRILARALLKRMPVSTETRCLWEISARPAYLLGVWSAANQAIQEGCEGINVIEFGVAGGSGLVALQEEARAVESETGVRISVYGFDNGPKGLPHLCGDYRDHPDLWKSGDFKMDVAGLRSRLDPRTDLILGDVRDTVPEFVERQTLPVGFVSFDLDLYSSTVAAMEIFRHPDRSMLMHVPLYFDDIDFIVNHRFAGELLAIDEFNATVDGVKIDKWYGVRADRPFPERHYFAKMFVAHDLDAITNASLARDNREL